MKKTQGQGRVQSEPGQGQKVIFKGAWRRGIQGRASIQLFTTRQGH